MHCKIISLAFVIALSVGTTLCAAESKKVPGVLDRYRAKMGGYFERPDSYRGQIAFLDAQNVLAADEIRRVAAQIAQDSQFNVAYQQVSGYTTPEKALKDSGVNLAVIVVADDTTPKMLIAPEDRWAVVNVAKLAKANRELSRRELLRAYSLLCGGGSSCFPGGLFNEARIEDAEDCQEKIPTDLLNAHKDYLKKLGVTPRMGCLYQTACQEGWAPKPTNDVQQAIWDKVHKAPTAPIVIKPETKKVR